MADTLEHRRTKQASLTDRSAIVAKLQAQSSEMRKRGVTSLALFGSRARGDERDNSDLDLLIDYDRTRPFTLYDLVEIERFLRRVTGLKAHVTVKAGFRPERLRRVLKDAVNVF
jgi:predicted nucleotidyltransferase